MIGNMKYFPYLDSTLNDYDDDDYCDHDDDVAGKDTVCWWGPGHS